MFTLHPGGAPADGLNVSTVDFSRLLSLFYPRNVISGDLSTLDEWTSVLRLAHMYEFEGHRTLAIERLKTLATPIDRILLAREYLIDGWLEDAYTELCMREEPLTLDEGVRLGVEDVVRLADIRQSVRATYRIVPKEQHIRTLVRYQLSTRGLTL
ncbi:hypothetical protein C8Q77DRAFT_1214404 [Trametes polyzona]|nr:hypothetical protein C8Q77DRAFT_1214404 [Trametes polyzona]